MAGEFFDFVRIKIAAALDDDVFHPASDKDFPFSAISAVASIYPGGRASSGVSCGKQYFCGSRIVEVAAGRGWPAKPEKSFAAIGSFISGIVHDTYFMIRNRAAGRDKRDGIGVRGCGHCAPFSGKGFAFDMIDARAAIEGRKSHRERSFREAVNGKLRFAAKSIS